MHAFDEHATTAATTTDVAIVGAGPTGLALGALLASDGVRVTMLERRATTSDEPKAISLDDESLRTFQKAGLIDRIIPIIVPGVGTMYFDRHGEELFHATGPTPYRLGYPFKNPFAQPDLERALAAALAVHPMVDLRFGTEVTGVAQDADGVTLEFEGGSVRARYAVAADGGSSGIRKRVGISMVGRSYDDVWLVVDTLGDTRTERYGMHVGDPDRPHVIIPGLQGRCRYEFLLKPGEGRPGEKPDFELIRDLVSRYRTLQPQQVERAVMYVFHGLNAERWREGRVFLAGDAAHMMPPFAGQGLNSGIRDAHNLAWKLTAALRGEAGEALLDSYDTERRPHAGATIGLSERLGRIVMTTRPGFAEQRDRRVRRFLASERGRTYLTEMQYRPMARFAGGAVVNGPGTAVAQPRAYASDTHQVQMFDDILHGGWAVLGVEMERDGWEAANRLAAHLGARTIHVPIAPKWPADMPVDAVAIDVDGAVVAEYAPYTGQFVVVRPDRVIAGTTSPADVGAFTARLAERLGAPWDLAVP